MSPRRCAYRRPARSSAPAAAASSSICATTRNWLEARQWCNNCCERSAVLRKPPLLETVPCDDPWHYRNHMRFSVNRGGQPGLTARGTHRVLPLTSCPIAHEQINTRPQRVEPGAQCTAPGTDSLRHGHQPDAHSAVAQRGDHGKNCADAGLDVRAETMEEKLAGETFRIRPSSFFQTNTAQAEKMAQMVLDGLLRARSHPRHTNRAAQTVCRCLLRRRHLCLIAGAARR